MRGSFGSQQAMRSLTQRTGSKPPTKQARMIVFRAQLAEVGTTGLSPFDGLDRAERTLSGLAVLLGSTPSSRLTAEGAFSRSRPRRSRRPRQDAGGSRFVGEDSGGVAHRSQKASGIRAHILSMNTRGMTTPTALNAFHPGRVLSH